MGLRLKGQLLALFLGLYSLAFLVVGYFNLTLVTEDNHLRTLHEADVVASEMVRVVMRNLSAPIGERSLMELATTGSNQLMGQFDKAPGLSYLELYGARGQKLFGFGQHSSAYPRHQEAMDKVRQSREPFGQLWTYDSDTDGGHPLESLGPFYHGRVGFEHYTPVFDDHNQVCGVIHVTLQLPRAPLRINLVVLGNLMLGAIFLISSLLAFNLWGEYALNRPLRGLVEAERRLKSLESGPGDDDELLSSNELVTISRSFNRMALDLVKYQRELEEKTVRLEQANLRYRQLNEGLEATVEEKTREMKEFFSLVTHDLRIPLAAVAGYAELLLKQRTGALSEKQEKFVRNVLVANSHAQDLVRNLLDAMRYEFGSLQLVEQEFDVASLVEEVVSHLVGSNIEVAVASSVVYADRTRIGRVLTNLLGNAVRHAGEQARVSLEVKEEGDLVRVEIRDQGPGIPQEHLPLLFEKFTQFPSEEGPSSGLGLGLYIVRRILEDHGRTIEVESEPGKGTRFWFTLPKGKNALAREGDEP